MSTTLQYSGPSSPPGSLRKDTQNMSDTSTDWITPFSALFEAKIHAYEKGLRNIHSMFSKDEEIFLATIGATPQEIFDFVEDWCDDGDPDPETALAITRIRRDYFLNQQEGKFPAHRKPESEFPARGASLAGMEWFPRIIAKAQAKLLGELPSDLMYACGGDRRFLNRVNVTPVEFLEKVRDAGENLDEIVQFVTNRSQT